MHFVKAKSILSPTGGMNIYRGCAHGCIYCDSRSRCYHMEHPFEDIEVKENAIKLLDDALRRRRKKCMIGTGSMSDPYIPAEMRLCYMRRAMELILKHGFGFTLITKSCRVERDIDLLRQINQSTKCVVQMTLTTYDDALCKKIEPNVSTTAERAETLMRLRDAGIPTIVWLTPILPFINDTAENIEGILSLCKSAGVRGVIHFGMGVTMREGNREYFYAKLDELFPGLKQKYMRTYGYNYELPSPNTATLEAALYKRCAECGIECDNEKLFAYLHSFEQKQTCEQISMF